MNAPPTHLSESTTWPGFWIGPDGEKIALSQTAATKFELGSELWYGGDIGIEIDDLEIESNLRSLEPKHLEYTDLASVPPPFRWWVNTYGLHTPAALIHDRFIGDDELMSELNGISEQQIDRYFRFMLKTLGMGVSRRWLLWGAVAARTRWMSGLVRRLSLIAWVALALVGLYLAYRWVTGSFDAWWIPLLSPIPASALCGKQWGAGIFIAYLGVPSMLLPALLAAVGIVATALMEASGERFHRLVAAWREVREGHA